MRYFGMVLVMALGGLAACERASPFVDTSGVREAAQSEVGACMPLTIITTTLGVSGTIGRDQALEIARNETKSKAREAGADTVVWESGGPGSDDLFVRAATYNCA